MIWLLFVVKVLAGLVLAGFVVIMYQDLRDGIALVMKGQQLLLIYAVRNIDSARAAEMFADLEAEAKAKNS